MGKETGTARLESACEPIAERMGYELVDISIVKEPAGKYLRFYIDKEEGVTLDDCEAFHKTVRDLADAVDYDFMEVSSPGIDRPLRKDRDFERAAGTEVEVRLFRAVDGVKLLTSVLAGLEEGNIVIDTADSRILIPRKTAALVKPVVDMEGIEDVEFPEEDHNTDET